MNYFQDCFTVVDVKKRYKELAFKHHPDYGGDTLTMQVINHQYEEKLKSFDGQKTTDSDNKEHTYRYDQKVEQELMYLIDRLLCLKMVNVDIYLIGLWVWVDGDTKAYKESLKELKCRWHSVRKCWYFAGVASRYRKNTNKGIDDIAGAYGAVKFNHKNSKQLTIA